jgi:hypothetical protein
VDASAGLHQFANEDDRQKDFGGEMISIPESTVGTLLEMVDRSIQWKSAQLDTKRKIHRELGEEIPKLESEIESLRVVAERLKGQPKPIVETVAAVEPFNPVLVIKQDPSLEKLHEAVPIDHWIPKTEVVLRLGITLKELYAMLRKKECMVYMPSPGRIAWKPGRSKVETGPTSTVPGVRKPRGRKPSQKPPIGAAPLFKIPPMIGFREKRQSANDEFNFPPMHNKAVEIGKTLIDPWTVTDLIARVGGDSDRAVQWINSWLDVQWVETCGYRQFRKTKEFGG